MKALRFVILIVILIVIAPAHAQVFTNGIPAGYATVDAWAAPVRLVTNVVTVTNVTAEPMPSRPPVSGTVYPVQFTPLPAALRMRVFAIVPSNTLWKIEARLASETEPDSWTTIPNTVNTPGVVEYLCPNLRAYPYVRQFRAVMLRAGSAAAQ